MNPVVHVENLDFMYGRTKILENVSLEISQGEFVAIIGPNGGGKTTLLKLITGFLSPLNGKVRVFDKTPKQARKLISYVPQVMRYDRNFPISSLEVVLTGCLQQSSFFGGFRKKEKERALHALEQVGMSEYRDSALGTLSGGQAQRVLIARALVSNPQLLLLDEPTAGVDRHAEDEIYEILSHLLGDVSVVMVTHNLQAVLEHLSSVVVVCRQVKKYPPKDVCLHFAAGIYDHPHGITESEESL
jgi:zinc transport system ATP-binding protein